MNQLLIKVAASTIVWLAGIYMSTTVFEITGVQLMICGYVVGFVAAEAAGFISTPQKNGRH
jgi:hypothetical protein